MSIPALRSFREPSAEETSTISVPLRMLMESGGYARVTTGRTRDGVEVVFVNGKRVDEWLDENPPSA